MKRYEGVKFVFISPDELKMPSYVIDSIKGQCEYSETASLEEALPTLDILYMTRVQSERFSNKDDYERLKDSYILTSDKLADAKADMAILHPLPRITEITTDVDDDPRAAYFEQAACGRYMRMALILKLLKEKTSLLPEKIDGEPSDELICTNRHCISGVERGIKKLFRGGRCVYCDRMAKHK